MTRSGGVKCWGRNNYCPLGEGSKTNCTIPVDVLGLESNITAISTGFGHICALTRSGGVKCWGDNTWGQLGDSAITDSTKAVYVQGLENGVAAISAKDDLTCALTRSGGVMCWGSNGLDKLKNGAKARNSAIPVEVQGLKSDVIAISAGFVHSCALTRNSRIKCWGENTYGQLGEGTTKDSLIPVEIRD